MSQVSKVDGAPHDYTFGVEFKNFLHRVSGVILTSSLGCLNQELRQGESLGTLHRKRD